MFQEVKADAEYEDDGEDEEEEEYEGKTYFIGGLTVLKVVAGLTFALSVWRLIDDPSYTLLSEEGFTVIMNYVVPIAVIILAMLMVVCMVDGEYPGSDVVPAGNLTKVIVLFTLYILLAVGAFYLKAFIPFVTGSFFGTCSVYFVAFILFSVNPMRNPMLKDAKVEPTTTSLSFYLFLVPAGFGLLNALCFLLATVLGGLSRLSSAKIAASVGFVVIQLVGHKNYPGFETGEYLCYLAGSLGLYVFSFTGVCLWTEEAIIAQTASFSNYTSL